jgi:serine protease Do
MRLYKKTKTYITLGIMVLAVTLGFGIENAVGLNQPDVSMVPSGFTHLSEMLRPSVVNIRTVTIVKGGGNPFGLSRKSPFGGNDPFHDFFERFYGGQGQRDFKQRSLGSGFIIDKEGYIVTNNHVIENADEITVVLQNEKEFKAEIIGRDAYTDIALIKIKSEVTLSPAKLGDSDSLDVGQWVVAIGNPFGLAHTVTAGIVSAKGRIVGSGPYDDFIQTDASINPGNSGGPLINMNGEVIGINTMIIAGGQGIGFAIPINLAKGIINQLKESGDVTRGWLGVTIQDLKGEIAEYYGLKDKEGAMIVDVVPGDPADQAGILPKDIIISVNDKKINSSRDLTAMVANIGVGETAKIKVMRDGNEKLFKVKIGKRPDTIASSNPMEKKNENENEIGLRVSTLTPQMARQLNVDENSGVIVVQVLPDSKAEKAGFLQGDVVIELNRKNIKNVNDFESILISIKKDETIAFLIKRMHSGLIVIHMKK